MESFTESFICQTTSYYLSLVMIITRFMMTVDIEVIILSLGTDKVEFMVW